MFPSKQFLAPLLFLFGAVSAHGQKAETWIEVRSPHFVVVSNAGERQARGTAGQFEQFRTVYQSAFPKARVDSSTPLIIFAVKDEKGLKALLPEFWEKKGQMHPAGYFQAGTEKNYAALRLDTQGEYPFHVIYHEYVHMLTRLNFDELPIWLSEGLAELFGYATLGEKQSLLGRASEYRLQVLKDNRLLPIDVLLTVDHKSPHYSEANKTTIFYAQSWALTHYLMLGDKTAHFNELVNYLNLLQQGVPEKEAATRAFGDLKQLEKKLEAYVRQESYYVIPVKTAVDIDEKQFPVRMLAPAESLALRGDFYLHTQRFNEARAALEQALQLDPNSAAANESLGFLYFRQNNREAAAKYLANAVKLDSRSFLAHYYSAMFAFQRQDAGGALEEAENHLRRSLELNPAFAPSYSNLATLIAARGGNLEQALQFATTAAKLEPGELSHHLSVASVLLRMERVDEAVTLLNRIIAGAKTEENRTRAMMVLSSAQQLRDHLAEKKRYEELRKVRQKEFEERQRAYEETRKKEEEETRTRVEALKKSAAQSPPKSPKRSGTTTSGPALRASMEGIIAEVICTNPAVIVLSLEIYGKPYLFRAENYFKLEYVSAGWSPPENFQPCRDLKGLTARLEFTPTPGTDYFGQLQAIEIRK